MNATESLDASAVRPAIGPGRTAARHSLRIRLSLLTTLLVAAVLAIFLFASNRALRRATLQAGNERALAASTQVATVLAQNTRRGLTELQRMSRDPILSAFLAAPSDTLRPDVERLLRPLAIAGQGPVALLNGAGATVFQIAAPDSPLPAPIAGIPASLGVGLLHPTPGGIYADVVAEIGLPHDGQAAERKDVVASGYVVVRRMIRPGANPGAVNRLIGAGAALAMGNREGGVWTDLNRQIPAPPIDATHSGMVTYTTAQGEQRTGGLSVVDGTPWAVWIDLGENLVLAPARVAVVRMTWLAVACIGLAMVAGMLLSRRITKPLDELTSASEAIAAGALNAHVNEGRRDEIGRLAKAFNVMSDHVATAQRELEGRVRRRTAKLEEAHALLGRQVEELEQTHAELERRANELASLNHELEAFSYSVSHDLRAPLRHIHGFVGLMEQSVGGRLTDNEKRWLNTIASASSRMGRLIDDLLEFSKTSRAALVRHPVDLNDLVTDLRKELSADGTGREIEWRVGALPTVAGDAALLRQVFVNLFSNAIKYSRGREHTVIEVGAAADDAGHAVVFVRDNGVGFDMRYANKLFGVFQRLHNDEQFEGTGIGLANVQRIVHRHGGRVWADARVDQGATFFVALPRA